MNRNVVYEVMEQKMCPGGYSFPWDGTMNTGYYGYPPEEGSNIAPAGLYTFDVEVEANPYDRDELRGRTLSVDSVLGGLYYDDKGTEDESDDEEFLVVEYVLKSDRNASSGEIWLYDPDFNQVGRWDTYGLTASLLGVQHTIFIPISLSALFEKDGTYWVVLFFKDNHADQYKNHQLKTTILGYSGICETYYSGEVDGQVTYFKHLWPEELEEELLALAEAIPPDAKECPNCKGSIYPGVTCNGVHYIRDIKGNVLAKGVRVCLVCNAMGYTAKTWPEDKLSLNPPKTTERDRKKNSQKHQGSG